MTSWTTCWSRSHRLRRVSRDLASPSTSPPSSSMASLLCTTDSVLFSWVRNHEQVRGERDLLRQVRCSSVLSNIRGGSTFCVLPEELQSIIGQLLKQRTSQKIDIDDHSRWVQVLLIHVCLHFQTENNTCYLLLVVSQTSSALPGCSVSPGRGRRSSRPLIRSDVHAGRHAQSHYTDTGTQITM